MAAPMTPRERWLAALRMKPVDRLPFWPKLDGGYPRSQGAPFRDMDLDAIHDWIGSDKHTWIGDCTRVVRERSAVEHASRDGVMRTVYRAGGNELILTRQYDACSNSWHPVRFPVRRRDDIKVLTDVYRDTRVELDEKALREAGSQAERIGESALTCNGIGESPLMEWIEWLAGVADAHLLLFDHPQEVEELFQAMHAVLLAKTKILCEHSPADAFYLIENTSTTLLSPAQFRQYCAHHVGDVAALTQAAGRNLILHMCGHLKALLPDLARIPAQAFEAFTSPTLGNTSLLDGRSACPGTCLIGGTNAVLWTTSADRIIAQIEKDLAALPHHRGIVLTSAGVMPPLCRPETIRQVCEWVKHYPARMDGAGHALPAVSPRTRRRPSNRTKPAEKHPVKRGE